MNERIKELAEQAGLKMCSCGCDMPTRQTAKFAELIIEECSELTLDYKNKDYYSGWLDYRDLIKEHFGIEE